MELEGSFRKFASNIEPAQTHRDEAISGHTTLRERLEKDSDVKVVLKETFLSGSYRRRTAVKPIKDVDIFVVLAGEQGSARKTLEWLEKALGRLGYKAKTAPQRRSVRVDLSYVTMDVVPALAPEGLDRPLKIPARQEDKWILSHPKKHIEYVENLNQLSSDERLVPTVKMIKWWRGYQMEKAKHPKSFFLENLCCRHVNMTASSYAEACVSIFESMVNSYGQVPDRVAQIADPGLSGQMISTGITLQEFQDFMGRVHQSLGAAQAALRSDNEKDSAALWRQVFGPEFPGSDDGGAKSPSIIAGPSALRRSPRDVRESPPFA
ncbi:MAG: hypothetical protein A2992_06265 [Elusimicrobia bacterium RIFCSPLOWO2_01_FULL_59_12]|nr:MAG: hypothetical protein A2992_06265 [Elusimicrobia bacterium RIFCSPLOWO2_01_FULL_59_12]